MDEHGKEISELCDELRRELIDFYENKVVSLENDCARYRRTAQILVEKKQKSQEAFS